MKKMKIKIKINKMNNSQIAFDQMVDYFGVQKEPEVNYYLFQQSSLQELISESRSKDVSHIWLTQCRLGDIKLTCWDTKVTTAVCPPYFSPKSFYHVCITGCPICRNIWALEQKSVGESFSEFETEHSTMSLYFKNN